MKDILATVYGSSTALDPIMDCKPLGVPRTGVGVEEHLQIIQHPNIVALLWENDPGPVYRVVYTDGRQHPKDLDTSYMGHSVGHWEGETLVVDVVGLNDETWIGGGTQGPRGANIHSDKEHVVERWTRNGDDLTYEATVEDPRHVYQALGDHAAAHASGRGGRLHPAGNVRAQRQEASDPAERLGSIPVHLLPEGSRRGLWKGRVQELARSASTAQDAIFAFPGGPSFRALRERVGTLR